MDPRCAGAGGVSALLQGVNKCNILYMVVSLCRNVKTAKGS